MKVLARNRQNGLQLWIELTSDEREQLKAYFSGKRRRMKDELLYSSLLNTLERAVTQEHNESQSQTRQSLLQETTEEKDNAPKD